MRQIIRHSRPIFAHVPADTKMQKGAEEPILRASAPFPFRATYDWDVFLAWLN